MTTQSEMGLLAELADMYRKQLHGDDPKGRQMLRRLGVHSKDTLEAFGIGYSDGKLRTRISDGQRKALQSMGLLTHNNLETLGSGLVLPASLLIARDTCIGETVLAEQCRP